jgi:DNA-binding IclR family transcriptional regulator
MAVERGRPTLIRSVQRALRLLEVVGEREGRATAKEIAAVAGLPLATTYHLLRTCTHEGWLQRLDDGTYVVGHRLDTVHRRGRDAAGVALARPALEWLRDAAGGPVYLARYVDGEVVVVEIVDGPKAPRIDLCVGLHDAAHATALGKCILGQLAESQRDEYLSRHPLHDLTPHTVVDRRRLTLPAPGQVAVDEEEYALGIHCLAAPVVDPHHLAAVGVVIPLRGHDVQARSALVRSAERASRAFVVR